VRDWKAIVREKLSPLPLSNERAADVIEEIAQQLESAYDDARRRGATEDEALSQAYEQTGDWEKLRSRVFRSVEGGLLPLWEQRGVFAPRRLPVWIALLATLAFLALPEFRQVVTMLPVPKARLEPLAARRVVTDADLRRLERSGNKQAYARALAFVALHTDNNDRAVTTAKEAIAVDPQLTWVAASVSHAMEPIPGRDPKPWIDRLKAWDPGNAYPYMLEASARIAAERGSAVSGLDSARFWNAVEADPVWRSAMDKASAATRVDFYWDGEFVLDREVLEEEGFNRPEVLLAARFQEPFPDVAEINSYVGMLLDEAHSAARSGNADEALEKYWKVVSFSQKVNAASQFPLAYGEYRRGAFEGMLPLLVKGGRLQEADAVRAILASDDRSAERMTQEYKERERASQRSADMVFASALCFEFLALATLVWLLLAAILKWKSGFSRDLNWMASGLCFAPPALALASVALFLSYFPYARSIGAITSERDLVTMYVPLVVRFSTVVTNPAAETWIARMFWPSLWCIALGISGAFLVRWQRQRASHD
jgi:tetratricopeptide (TPR) repeat protein